MSVGQYVRFFVCTYIKPHCLVTHVLRGLLITDTLGPVILSTVERLSTLKNVRISMREKYILFPLKGVLCREVILTASVITCVLYSKFP